MKEQTLAAVFLDELRDTYDAERQLTRALPKVAKSASSEEFREAITMHLEETKGQVQRLESVFESIGQKARGKKCEGMQGLIGEAQQLMEEHDKGPVLDAALIAAAQKVEHYEIAAYGSLCAWAEALGYHDAVDLLKETLEEEKTADEKLTEVAASGVNEEALVGAGAPE
ncbi:MAG: ferritin-like domain-containing protein [Bryobacteraceae bacterium]|nr:ferritin-like domain-containing protein [Bryobacteraceae bacterium]